MNLFQQYGIKEVADVVFYSITKIGDEEFYVPVLFLDTLKVTTLNQSASKVSAEGGYANKKLIGWNFGKDIKLTLEDALFSPASMSMLWGGDLQAKLSPYTSAIVKINLANKYGRLHYSTRAYSSPEFTDEEWDIIYKAVEIQKVPLSDDSTKKFWDFSGKAQDSDTPRFWKKYYVKDDPIIEQNRTELRKRYFQRSWAYDHEDELSKATLALTGSREDSEYGSIFNNSMAMPQIVINTIISFITEITRLGKIDTDYEDIEVVDRMEKCVVKSKNGLTISTVEQKKNLLKYYQNDRTSSYTIYYDAKTMQPLLNLSDNIINSWNTTTSDKFTIKTGTIYYKWSRTVKYKTQASDGILGKTLVIDAEQFPGLYKIVGETYIREQKTHKDQRYQFVINKAQVSNTTNIVLQADGEPTTFSMDIDVLNPLNGAMIELKQFDVDDDYIHGGTRIVPQNSDYTYTPTITEFKEAGFNNDEIY